MLRRQFLLGVGAIAGTTVVNLLGAEAEAKAAAQRAATTGDQTPNLVNRLVGSPSTRSVEAMGMGPTGLDIEVPPELRATGVPVFEPAPPPPPRAAPTRVLSGSNIEGWTEVVGDGVHANPGEPPVGIGDIATEHRADHSVLRANVDRRAIMAHNITYNRVADETALDYHHFARYRFRLPHALTTDNREFSAQTIEGGLFIWDGAGQRLEHGVGFQWTINPWSKKYGWVKSWSGESQDWLQAGYLEPDQAWHTLSFNLDPRNGLGLICLDDHCVGDVYASFPKPDSWGGDVSARLQIEIISLDPGNKDTAPEHQVEVRDWIWEWSPSAS